MHGLSTRDREPLQAINKAARVDRLLRAPGVNNVATQTSLNSPRPELTLATTDDSGPLRGVHRPIFASLLRLLNELCKVCAD
jgi:hypothetical protein